jgi:outer membrane protein OmpA-like peptidoglycan-associated protein
MTRSSRVKQAKPTPAANNPQHTSSSQPERSETPSAEAAPESLAFAMDAVEQTLRAQGMSGEGTQFSMDSEARAQNLLVLQQAVGNRSVQRILQRQPAPAPAAGVTPAVAPPTPDASLPEDLRNFRTKGPAPADAKGTTINTSVGGGSFNARYDPASMALTITINIGMNFLDGMKITGNRVTATQNSMDDSAVGLNRMLSRLRGEKRTKALEKVKEQWTWTGAGDPRITAWMGSYRSNVMGAWSSAGTGIIFQGSRPGWESQLAKVNVVVNTQNATGLAAGAAIPGPQPVHCKADIYKTPDEDVFGAQVTGRDAATGTPEKLELGSGQVVAQSHLLTQDVFFANNSARLGSRAKEKLKRWIISFQATPGTAGNSIAITGHANTTGQKTEAGRERNLNLSFDRAQAVETFLKTTSVEGSLLRNASTRISGIAGVGAGGAGEEADWRRVDIVVGSGQGQNIAAHEFGHMLGLADEYASTPKKDAAGNPITDAKGDQVTRGLISGTGGDVGSTTGHDALGKSMGVGGSVHENNDNIMSLGSTVRPQHYATFMEALHTVSGVNDWKVKA